MVLATASATDAGCIEMTNQSLSAIGACAPSTARPPGAWKRPAPEMRPEAAAFRNACGKASSWVPGSAAATRPPEALAMASSASLPSSAGRVSSRSSRASATIRTKPAPPGSGASRRTTASAPSRSNSSGASRGLTKSRSAASPPERVRARMYSSRWAFKSAMPTMLGCDWSSAPSTSRDSRERGSACTSGFNASEAAALRSGKSAA